VGYLCVAHLIHVVKAGSEVSEEERDGVALVVDACGGLLAACDADESAELAYEVEELVANGIADLADTNSLQHAGVAELLEDHAHLVGHGLFAVVGLDAAHEPRLALAHLLDETCQRLVELGGHRGRLRSHCDEAARLEAAFPLALAVLAQVAEHLGEQRVAAVDEHVDDISAQQVAVLVQEVLDLVDDLARVVADDEDALARARLLVQWVAAVYKVAFLQEREVRRLVNKKQTNRQTIVR
jgi:hypothetical protein